MTAAIVMLAKQFWNIVIVVICGVLMWIPVLSFFTLLVVNQKATRFLKQYGIDVGLLGADYKQI